MANYSFYDIILKVNSQVSTYYLDNKVSASKSYPDISIGNQYDIGKIVEGYLYSLTGEITIKSIRNSSYSPSEAKWSLYVDLDQFTTISGKSILNGIKSNILNVYNYPSYILDNLITNSQALLTIGDDPSKSSLPVQSTATQSSNITQPGVTQSVVNTIIPIAQETSRGELNGPETINKDQKNTDGSFPGIKSITLPTLRVDPIKIEIPSGPNDKEEFTKGLGYLPFVWYNGYQIDYKDIKYLSLYHDGIIPKCKITFSDTLNIIKSKGFPLDDTKIQLFINAKSSNLKSIHLEFKVQNFIDNGSDNYTVLGTINIPELYLKKYKSYTRPS